MAALINSLSFLIVADIIQLDAVAFASLQMALNSIVIAGFLFFENPP